MYLLVLIFIVSVMAYSAEIKTSVEVGGEISTIQGADTHDSNLEDRLMKLESAVGQLKKNEHALKGKVDSLEEQIKLLEMQDAQKVSQIQSLEETIKTMNETKEILLGQDVLRTCHELWRLRETVEGEHEVDPDVEVQPSLLQKNITILWKTVKSKQPFAFNDMDDGLKENDCCQNHTIEINIMKADIINIMGVVAHNAQTITENANSINDNAHSIDNNTFYIVENQLQIQTDRKQTDNNTNNIDTNKISIDTNKNNIDTNTNNIDTNTNNIDTNKNDIDTNNDDIDTNNNNINSNSHDITTNMETIEILTNLHVSQCGWKHYMTALVRITYSRLETDVNSLNRGGLDIGTGVFTAPIQGTYLVTINYNTWRAGIFYIYPYKNGGILTDFAIKSETHDNDADSAGRTFTTILNQNDQLHVQLANMTGQHISWINFCITLIK